MDASQLMTRDVYFVDPDEDLLSIWGTMKMLNIRHVPVVDASRPVGMISDRDILAYATLQANTLVIPSLKARAVMASPVVTCQVSTPLSEVGRAMLTHKIDSVVIVSEDGELNGLVTSSDFIHLVVEREAFDLRSPTPFAFRLKPLRR